MITAVDTNILALIFDRSPHAAQLARELHLLSTAGSLVICGVVYAELMAAEGRHRDALDHFLDHVGVQLDAAMNTAVWAEAGRANADYHGRRRAHGYDRPKPVLPDFLIGAHAQHRADRLFTENAADFSDFPALTVIEATRPHGGQ